MIKYIGSKRRLVPVLGELCSSLGAHTALDLFTGTTRVAQEFKRRGAEVWAVDSASYAAVLAACYVATDASCVDVTEIDDALEWLSSLQGRRGYVTTTFCEQARYFQPHNGMRIDAMRDGIESSYAGTWLHPVLLTSLLEAADRVDSTTGVQMAYLKQWAPRAFKPLELRRPSLLAGPGHAVQADAVSVVSSLPPVDLAYLDPPYNQHRYFTNYHVWETLVAWDAPEHYGVACKRTDAREAHTRSVFNERRHAADALASVIASVRADHVVVSFSNEGWVALEELQEMCAARGGDTQVLAFDSARYVGARIGIYNPQGEKVGRVSHTENVEYVVVQSAVGR